MKTTLLRASAALALFFTAHAAFGRQVGEIDFSKATAKLVPLRGNVSLLPVSTPTEVENLVILSGPEGTLMVDHPEAAAGPLVRKTIGDLDERPVRFLINTHWHFDHVGGNEIYGPEAVIIAQENVRNRLSKKQKPAWSPASIGPYPERAWPRITFRDSLTIHFDGEEVELHHYANGHTDGDTVVYFSRANVVDVGDMYGGKGEFALGVDMEGMARSLGAVVEHTNDDTIVISGHGLPSNRRDLAEYVQLLNDTIALVKQELAAGKTDKEIQAGGLAEKWRQWPNAENAPMAPRLLHMIYRTLRDQDLDQ
jgi:cyclase